MRLKKVKNANELIKSSKYCIDILDLDINHQLFDNDNPIHLEIGVGKGNFINDLAKKNPNINYLGVELFDSVIVKAIQKTELEALNNLLFIKADAKLLATKFNNYFAHIYLNFSDPWPKNRHHKRRLSHFDYLEVYKKILKKNCQVTLKTDNNQFFEYTIKTINNYGVKIDKFSLDLHSSKFSEENILTEYEAKFSQLGVAIKLVEFTFI